MYLQTACSQATQGNVCTGAMSTCKGPKRMRHSPFCKLVIHTDPPACLRSLWYIWLTYQCRGGGTTGAYLGKLNACMTNAAPVAEAWIMSTETLLHQLMGPDQWHSGCHSS